MSNRPTVLFVDDEERIVRSLMLQFKSEFEVRGTTDPHAALDTLSRERVHVIVSDQRMPIMFGAELLRRAREASPATMRILLTGYSELDAIMASVNEGEVFRFVSKPWRATELQAAVRDAAHIAMKTGVVATAPLAPDRAEALRFLVIDSDESTYRTIEELLGRDHVVRWGANVPDAFEILAAHDTAVVISETRLGGEEMTESLKLLKQRYPQIVTIVLTHFSDTNTLIGLINQGQVYRFLPKPLRRGLLEKSLQAALAHYRTTSANPLLLERNRVEEPKAPPEARISRQVFGYFSRMRA